MTRQAPDTDRRAFLKSGALLATSLAAAAPAAARVGDAGGDLLARLEDERALSVLQRDVMRRINTSGLESVRALLPAQAPLLREAGLRRLTPDADEGDNGPVLSADRQSARCSYPCHVERHSHFSGNTTLEKMAREQGTAMTVQREKRVLEMTFVREKGGWGISDMSLA